MVVVLPCPDLGRVLEHDQRVQNGCHFINKEQRVAGFQDTRGRLHRPQNGLESSEFLRQELQRLRHPEQVHPEACDVMIFLTAINIKLKMKSS